MKKRIIGILFMLVLSSSLIACKSGKTSNKESTNTEDADESQEQEEVDYAELSESDLEVMAYDDDAKACYYLGLLYDYGSDDVEKQPVIACSWYKKAADLGYAEGYTALGYVYLNGIGEEANLDTAREYFQKGIDAGDQESLVGMGRSYIDDNVDENSTALAYQYISQAYNALLPDGVYYMAYLYEKGIGVDADLSSALKLYQQVDEMSDLSKTNEYLVNAANTRMGIIHVSDNPDVKDDQLALDYFQVAADEGYSVAEYYLGIMYMRGCGIDQSYDDALDWFQKAADKDYAPALNQLGCLYFNGYGVDVDYSQAVYYQKLAAAQDYTPAQINLGYMYENGFGVEKNLDTALAYYKLAADKSYEGASEAVARVESLMNETNE